MAGERSAFEAGLDAFRIEAESLLESGRALEEGAFERAVGLLAAAQRIAASGCGHSGIACQHFAHLMCCIERPARFISPAEAVHGATGYLKPGDVMLLASRGGKNRRAAAHFENLPPKGRFHHHGYGKCRLSPGGGRGRRSPHAGNEGSGPLEQPGHDELYRHVRSVRCAPGRADRKNRVSKRGPLP